MCSPQVYIRNLKSFPVTRHSSHNSMMTQREELIEYADRFLKYINNTNPDAEDPMNFLAPDLQTPLAYPGTTSGFDGTVGLIKKLHGALTKFSLTLVAPVVDEKECRVVYFVKSAGVQTG
jgi:hypothetical protein